MLSRMARAVLLLVALMASPVLGVYFEITEGKERCFIEEGTPCCAAGRRLLMDQDDSCGRLCGRAWVLLKRIAAPRVASVYNCLCVHLSGFSVFHVFHVSILGMGVMMILLPGAPSADRHPGVSQV